MPLEDVGHTLSDKARGDCVSARRLANSVMARGGKVGTDVVQTKSQDVVRQQTRSIGEESVPHGKDSRTLGTTTVATDAVSFVRVVKGEGLSAVNATAGAPKMSEPAVKEARDGRNDERQDLQDNPSKGRVPEGEGHSAPKTDSPSVIVADGEVPDRSSSLSAPPDLEISSRALFAFKAGYTSVFTDAHQHSYVGPIGEYVQDLTANGVEPAIGPDVNLRLPQVTARAPGMRREDSDASVEDLILRASRMPPLSSSNLARDDSEISLTSLTHVVDFGGEDSFSRERHVMGSDPTKSGYRSAPTGMPSMINTEMWRQVGGLNPESGQFNPKTAPIRPSPNLPASQNPNLYFLSEQSAAHQGNSHFTAFQQSAPWGQNGRVDLDYSPFHPAFPAALAPFSAVGPTSGYPASGFMSGYNRSQAELNIPVGVSTAEYGPFGPGSQRDGVKREVGVPSDYMPFDKNRGRHVSFGTHQPNQSGRALKTPVTTGPVNGAAKFLHFSEVVGRVRELARDQHGCRYLQTKLEEGNPQYTGVIFEECFEEFVDLMVDPFGNYLCQKLFEHCEDSQRLLLTQYCADSLARVSSNMHGTRAVQRMVECLSTPEQISTACKALAPSAVFLMKDINGNHVIQRCLQRMDSQNNQFVYDSVANNCVDLATHRHGCCVMQRCIDAASPAQKDQLVKEITSNALLLVQNPFGNYVVQYVLELGDQNYTMEIIKRLQGHVGELSTQKFSSNVVEKCLQRGNAETRGVLIDELISDSEVIGRLLHDAFGNYVIQRSLQLARSPQLEALCDAIRPHLPSLKSSPYGKRIQTKILKRFPKNRTDRDDFNL